MVGDPVGRGRRTPAHTMAHSYLNLFMYETIDVVEGQIIHFEGITILKRFPDDNFILGDRYVCACVNPLDGSIFLYNDIDDLSKIVKIQDWIDYPGLCRTDTSSFRFVTTGKM